MKSSEENNQWREAVKPVKPYLAKTERNGSQRGGNGQ